MAAAGGAAAAEKPRTPSSQSSVGALQLPSFVYSINRDYSASKGQDTNDTTLLVNTFGHCDPYVPCALGGRFKVRFSAKCLNA